jgi:hypothetical protein
MAHKHNIKPGQLWGLGRKIDEEDIWYYVVLEVDEYKDEIKFLTVDRTSKGINYGGHICYDDIKSVAELYMWHRVL